MSGSARPTVLQSLHPADFPGLPAAFATACQVRIPVPIGPSNKIQNERRFRSPHGHRHLDCAQEIFAGHNTMSSSPAPLIAKDTLKVWEIIFPIFTRTPALA
jgi:hypothetical protein